MVILEKIKNLTPLQKLPKNGGDWGKLIVAKGFKKCKKIAQSGHTANETKCYLHTQSTFQLLIVISFSFGPAKSGLSNVQLLMLNSKRLKQSNRGQMQRCQMNVLLKTCVDQGWSLRRQWSILQPLYACNLRLQRCIFQSVLLQSRKLRA